MIEIAKHSYIEAGGLTFHLDTIISMLIVSSIIIVCAAVIRFFFLSWSRKSITNIQAGVEMASEAINDMPYGIMGEKGLKFAPIIATLFIFILASNWFALFPLNAFYQMFFESWLGHIPEITAPTTDLNFTAGLALVVFFSTHFFGMREKGPGYFKRFLQPMFLFLPLNIIEELAKPFSLALRLFGNMFGKETILLVLISLVALPLLYPIPIMALSMFIGLIQAFIFALLATFYIAGAVSDGH